MTALYMFLAAVCVLGPLVALHEWGHYIVARLCGVKVLTYSIGFGPKLFGWTSKRSGIDYRISAIPLGGYVRMLDEREAPVDDALKSVAFNNQHPLKKIAIVAAGPLMNFAIAITLFWVLLMMPSEQLATRIGSIVPDSPAAQSGLQVGDKIVSVDGRSVQTWEQTAYALAAKMGESTSIDIGIEKAADAAPSEVSVPVSRFMQTAGEKRARAGDADPITSFGALPFRPTIEPIIGQVVAGGAAELMGLKANDKVLAIDGVPTADWVAVTDIIRVSPEKMLTFSILRDGSEQQINIMPRGVKAKDGSIRGQIGVQVAYDPAAAIPPEYRTTISYSASEAFSQSFVKTYDLAKMTLNAMGKMITGMIGLENLSGPITIAEVSKTSFEIGWQQVLSTAALISLSLAVLNLLPIPVLDGGHLVFYTYELIVGKPMPEALQMNAMKVGMLLMLCFMALAIGNDILRLFG